MPPKKVKAGTVITSLFENDKRRFNNNNSGNSEDDDDENRKRSRKDKDDDDDAERTFTCHICHAEDPTVPKFSPKEIQFLEDNEQIMLKFKTGKEIKILCEKHYQVEIRNVLKRRERCCNVLSAHKSRPKTTNLMKISVSQAEDAMKYLGLKMIPFLHICRDCTPKLDLKIEEAKAMENNNPDVLPDNDNDDYDAVEMIEDVENAENTENEEVEEVEIGNVKHDILRKIAVNVENFTKEQKVAIVKVLPASWTTNEISTETGKLTFLCTYSGALKNGQKIELKSEKKLIKT